MSSGTRRSTPDSVQPEIVEALRWTGAWVIETHNVPVALPELGGFPDLIVVERGGLTLVGPFDPVRVRSLLRGVPGLTVWPGAVLPAEVKGLRGALRPEQISWWRSVGLPPVVLRDATDALRLLGQETDK